MTSGHAYFFAGGGTGGHLTPGLALAAELRADCPATRLLFVGSGRPVERRMVQEAGYEHLELPVESLQNWLRHPWRVAWNNWQAYRMAQALIQSDRPRGVIGLGGFTSLPLAVAAVRAGVPLLLLEQNTRPGRANRWLSPRAGKICLSFAESHDHFPPSARTIVTGNPVRRNISELAATGPPEQQTGPPTLLVLGGSQGASGLNQGVLRMMRSSARCRRWRVIHQAGPAESEAARAEYASLGVDAVVEPFFADLVPLYRQATLVVSRAGATTLAELACAGCPAVLVPFPAAVDNHQFFNALHYATAGGALIVSQSADAERTSRDLNAATVRLMGDDGARARMGAAMRQLAQPDATRRVMDELQRLVAGIS